MSSDNRPMLQGRIPMPRSVLVHCSLTVLIVLALGRSAYARPSVAAPSVTAPRPPVATSGTGTIYGQVDGAAAGGLLIQASAGTTLAGVAPAGQNGGFAIR